MALCVATGHYVYWNQNNAVPLSFILAVDYFFILSGYVLTGSILSKNNFDSFLFAKARWLRLFPVYIFAATISLILYSYLGRQEGMPWLGDIIKIVSIGQMLPFNIGSEFIHFEPLGIDWSISAEFWIGIIFFPILYSIKKYRPEIVFVFLMLSVLIPFFIINNYSPSFLDLHFAKYSPLIYWGLIRGYMGYSLGALCYFIINYINKNVRSLYLSLIQVLSILLIVIIYAKNSYNRSNEYFSIFLFAIMIISLSLDKGIIFKLTNNVIGKWFGKVSYPLYCLHPIFIHINSLIFKNPFSFISLATYFILVIESAILTHIFIENKLIIYFKKSNQ